MKTSVTITELVNALIKFQKEVGVIKKDSRNPHFKNTYASLSTILEQVNDHLLNNDLVIIQSPSGENGLTTRLCHSSGEWIEDSYSMPPQQNTPQGVGSAITYQRRYSIGAILSLNIDEDDDGNQASADSKEKPWLNPNTEQWKKAITYLKGDGNIESITKSYKLSNTNKDKLLNESL